MNTYSIRFSYKPCHFPAGSPEPKSSSRERGKLAMAKSAAAAEAAVSPCRTIRAERMEIWRKKRLLLMTIYLFWIRISWTSTRLTSRGGSRSKPGMWSWQRGLLFTSWRHLAEAKGTNGGKNIDAMEERFVNWFSFPRCEGCFQKTGPRGLKVICGCRCTFYCSEDCREGDRENHEDECYYFKKAKRAPTSDTARFLLR